VDQKPAQRYREEAARIRRYAEGVTDEEVRRQLANIGFLYDRWPRARIWSPSAERWDWLTFGVLRYVAPSRLPRCYR